MSAYFCEGTGMMCHICRNAAVICNRLMPLEKAEFKEVARDVGTWSVYHCSSNNIASFFCENWRKNFRQDLHSALIQVFSSPHSASMFISISPNKPKASRLLWCFVTLQLWSRHWVLRGIPAHCAAESHWDIMSEETFRKPTTVWLWIKKNPLFVFPLSANVHLCLKPSFFHIASFILNSFALLSRY